MRVVKSETARRSPGRSALRLVGALLAVALLSAGWVQAGAKKPESKDDAEEIDVDHVALAAVLIQDGHFSRAQKMLAEVDTKKKGIDLERYHTLSGIVHLHEKSYEKARDSFLAAIAAGAKKGLLYVQLAQAHYGLRDWASTVRALDDAGAAATEDLRLHLMKADCLWHLAKHAQAISTLAAAQKKFPDEVEPERRRVFYYVDLQLFQEAVRLGRPYLRRATTSEKEQAAMGAALRQAKQFELAQTILEGAHLRHPESEEVAVQLAHSYLEAGHTLTAAMIFEDLARWVPKYAKEAAELYKEARRFERALSLNARMVDAAEKAKQRLGILLAMERFELLSTMQPQLERLGLMADDDVRYAVAYAYFKTQQYDLAERTLKGLKRAESFEAAMQLRRAMASCKEQGWECNP